MASKASQKDLVWNLSPLYKSDNDPKIQSDRKTSKKLVEQFVKKWEKRTDYLQDPKALKKALDEFIELEQGNGIAIKESHYLHLREAQEEDNTDLKAKINNLSTFSIELSEKIEFFTNRVTKIEPKYQAKMLKAKELAEYRHYLEVMFRAGKYVLSIEEENIIGSMIKPARHNWVSMTSRFLSQKEKEVLGHDGKKTKKPFNEIFGLLSSNKHKIVDSAGKAIDEVNSEYAEVAEHEMNSILELKMNIDKKRGHSRPDESRHISDDIDPKVVDVLVDAVTKRFDLSERFYKLRAKLSGYKKIQYHQRSIDLGAVSKKFEYDEAVAIVSKVFEQIDPEFGKMYQDFLRNGQFDVFPRKGKTGGAFCSFGQLDKPTYILLNFDKQMRGITTIAHEMGHAVHYELTRNNQNILNRDISLAVAEVASTFFEEFVVTELSQDITEEERLIINIERLDDDIATIFRQVALYNFETELHFAFRKNGYLAKEEIGAIFRKHMESYLGKWVDFSDASENWWVYWSHIRNFFYVYSYASGLLVSKALQGLLKKDPKNVEKVRYFMSAGSSDSPVNVFKHVGIDMTKRAFWDKGLAETEALLEETEMLARKLKKI